MLDRRTAQLLMELNKICSDETYKVIEKEELCKTMPKKYKLTNEVLEQIIDHLVERKYVSLKYADENEVCVSVLPKGKLFKERNDELSMEKNKRFEIAWVAMICGAVGAFFGSALATIILLLIK